MGRFGGAFKDFSASDLGGVAIKAALVRANIAPEDVDEVFIGNALQSAESGYAARLAGLKGGIPQEVCYTIIIFGKPHEYSGSTGGHYAQDDGMAPVSASSVGAGF